MKQPGEALNSRKTIHVDCERAYEPAPFHTRGENNYARKKKNTPPSPGSRGDPGPWPCWNFAVQDLLRHHYRRIEGLGRPSAPGKGNIWALIQGRKRSLRFFWFFSIYHSVVPPTYLPSRATLTLRPHTSCITRRFVICWRNQERLFTFCIIPSRTINARIINSP